MPARRAGRRCRRGRRGICRIGSRRFFLGSHNRTQYDMGSATRATAILSVLLIAAHQAAAAPGVPPPPTPPPPDGWEAFKISDRKKLTHYRLVQEGGRPVLHAVAVGSASGLPRQAGFSLAERPIAS